MATLPPVFRQRYFSASGLPLSGGKLFTYQAGTVTPLVTYTDATEASANTNPIILDANGECNLWLGGNAYKIVLTDSANVVQWTQDNVNQGQINNAVSADLLENLGITVTPGGSATISVKTGAGNIPSISDPVRVGFRGSSLASGLVSLVNITSPLAMNLADGGTLGHSNGVPAFVYVYLINNNGVAELAVSSTIYQENALISTTIMNDSADSGVTIYSTVARSNVPIRLIARITSNQVTAGSWNAAPTEIQTGEEARRAQINTNQIADNAVTPPKIPNNSITLQKLAAINYVSASTGFGHSTSSTSFASVVSISLTSTGRLCLIGSGPVDGGGGYIKIRATAGIIAIANWQLWDATNSVALASGIVGTENVVAVNKEEFFGFSQVLPIILSAGTRTIQLRASVNTANSTARFEGLSLWALEL